MRFWLFSHMMRVGEGGGERGRADAAGEREERVGVRGGAVAVDLMVGTGGVMRSLSVTPRALGGVRPGSGAVMRGRVPVGMPPGVGVRAAQPGPLASPSSSNVSLLEGLEMPRVQDEWGDVPDADEAGESFPVDDVMQRRMERAEFKGTGCDGGRGRYHISTMGCQMNKADSERMAGVLEAAGWRPAADADSADVCVVNTCSIRDLSEQKVYSWAGRQAKRKREDPAGVRIVVAGCVAQQTGETLLRRMPEVDLVMGPQHVHRLAELLAQVELGSQVCATGELVIPEDITVPRRESDISAWVNVIYGCNENCSYCIVPSVRGREQSRKAPDIVREVAGLADAGYREVTLLGQNIDAYGRDLPGYAADGSGRKEWTFTDLLRAVHDETGIPRLRFATSHPRYFSPRLIKACAELDRVCEYFHIPFQAGDDEVLRRMRRGYTADKYRRIVGDLRDAMPDCSISADAIVGFPGETEAQFERTLRLVEELELDTVYTAAFSPRPGTEAAGWTGPDEQVADLIKADRLQRLNDAVKAAAEKASLRSLGRDHEEVLVEGPNPADPTQAFGRTRGNRLLYFPGDGVALRGSIVNVRTTDARAFSLTGHIVTDTNKR